MINCAVESEGQKNERTQLVYGTPQWGEKKQYEKEKNSLIIGWSSFTALAMTAGEPCNRIHKWQFCKSEFVNIDTSYTMNYLIGKLLPLLS